jgi:hypothetical protein
VTEDGKRKEIINKIRNFRQDQKHPHEVIHWNRRITASPWYKNQSTKARVGVHDGFGSTRQQFPKPD